MAELYKTLTPRKLAKSEGVQAYLDLATREIAALATAKLVEHRQSGHAKIDVTRGSIDRYVVLSDERGQKAALSIEYGRSAGEYEAVDPETGRKVTKQIGAMEGLFILADSARLPRKKKGRLKLNGRDI